MKWLAYLLVFMIAALPVQAGFCDLDPSADSAAHAGMQHGDGADAPQHDCCQPSDAGETNGCGDSPTCGHCSAGALAVPVAAAFASAPGWSGHGIFQNGRITPSHTTPPYRPPSSFS